MNVKNLIFVAVALLAINDARAISPPPTVAPVCNTVKISWTLPTTRADGSTIAISELAKTTLYMTNESAPIDVAAPATSYSYTIPTGYVTTSNDAVVAVEVDTSGTASANSTPVIFPSGLKCSKSSPAAPIGLGITTVK